jgi:hypothetical protein
MERVDNDGYVDGTITATTTLSLEQEFILVDVSAGPIWITLPKVSDSRGKVYHIKKIDSTTNKIYITLQSGDTIDGETSAELACQYNSISIVAGNDNEWSVF